MRETPRARQAWLDYLAMGPQRSLEKLLERYQTGAEPAPARNLTRLKQWSSVFGWQARLKEIAGHQAREAEEAEAAYRRSIMQAGYALAHERVKALDELAAILHGELLQDDKRWVADVKSIGSGENAQRVDIERFNHHEVEQFRGILDDIAQEVGERKQKPAASTIGDDDPLAALNEAIRQSVEALTQPG